MAAIAVLLALLAGGTQGATLRGVVTDARTTAPVQDAQVAIVELARTTRTGTDGRFEFRGLPPGGYTVTISTIGYIFVRRHVQAAGSATIDLSIPLAEGTGTYTESVTVSAETATPPSLGGASADRAGLSRPRRPPRRRDRRSDSRDAGAAGRRDRRRFQRRVLRPRLVVPARRRGDRRHGDADAAPRGPRRRRQRVDRDDQHRHPQPRRARERRTDAPPRRLAGRDARVRRSRRIARSARASCRGQRHRRIGGRGGPPPRQARRLARVGPEELPGLADSQDRAGHR